MFIAFIAKNNRLASPPPHPQYRSQHLPQCLYVPARPPKTRCPVCMADGVTNTWGPGLIGSSCFELRGIGLPPWLRVRPDVCPISRSGLGGGLDLPTRKWDPFDSTFIVSELLVLFSVSLWFSVSLSEWDKDIFLRFVTNYAMNLLKLDSFIQQHKIVRARQSVQYFMFNLSCQYGP